MATYTCVFLVTMFTLMTFSAASYLHVGRSDGWSSSKNINYTKWAETIHFQVDDVLIFEYDNKTENLLRVSSHGFKSCNLTAPSRKWTSGNDQIRLRHKGVYYFVSSLDGKCDGRAMVSLTVYENGHDTPSPQSPVPVVPSADSPLTAPAPAPKHSSAFAVKASLLALCVGFLIMISI